MGRTGLFGALMAAFALAFGGAFAQQQQEQADPAMHDMQAQQGGLVGTLCEVYLRIDMLLTELDPEWVERQDQFRQARDEWRQEQPVAPMEEPEVDPANDNDAVEPENQEAFDPENEAEVVEPAEARADRPDLADHERFGVADFHGVHQQCQLFAGAVWQDIQQVPQQFADADPIDPVERPEVDVAGDISLHQLQLAHERLALAISQLIGFDAMHRDMPELDVDHEEFEVDPEEMEAPEAEEDVEVDDNDDDNDDEG